MGEMLKTFGLVTVGCAAAYATSIKIDEYFEKQGEFEYSKEFSTALKVSVAQMIGIMLVGIDRHI